ncbi:MAG: hypothetical protein DRI32_04180 [Chloroflexi bacterium]|nr:MAG: hypothetical protein DRI32_04180 [Chloroflexota bacterium]
MKAKIIKTEAEYDAALAYVETLMDAEPNSPEEAELELFSVLVENYEKEKYPIGLPDPIEAIKFRMEQEGLTRKDMRVYLGSQSKVSEVLNRKRPLSLAMIRALHKGLDIPAEVLLQEPGKELSECKYNYKDFPFSEIFKRGYFNSFNGTLAQAKENAEELFTALFAPFGETMPVPIYRRNSEKEVDPNALLAWQAKVLDIALSDTLPPFSKDEFNKNFIREIVKLSYFSRGPQLAQELLNKKGIHFVVLSHLPKSYLDGACFYAPDGRPVIGLTLRYDRLDNFWYTLLHELAHLYLHFDGGHIAFFDDTNQLHAEDESPREKEANNFARDALIPPAEWDNAKQMLLQVRRDSHVLAFANQQSVSPAIVAGRIRWEKRSYTIFSQLVGNKHVRNQFPEYLPR